MRERRIGWQTHGNGDRRWLTNRTCLSKYSAVAARGNGGIISSEQFSTKRLNC